MSYATYDGGQVGRNRNKQCISNGYIKVNYNPFLYLVVGE